MKISFRIKTNKPYVMINTLKINLLNGTVITIDRKETEFSSEESDGTRSMIWRNCYLWAINEQNIFGVEGYSIVDEYSLKEFLGLIKNSTLTFELEDDVPDEDYKVEIVDFCIN